VRLNILLRKLSREAVRTFSGPNKLIDDDVMSIDLITGELLNKTFGLVQA
jgi:hypothetical protein